MNAMHKLAPWYSLQDTAQRLSEVSGETMTVDVLLQLVAEGYIPLSWRVVSEYAHPVAQICDLSNEAIDALGWGEAYGWGKKDVIEYAPPISWEDKVAVRREKDTGKRVEWAYLDWVPSVEEADNDAIVTGLFRFHLEFERTKLWIFGLLNDKSEKRLIGNELILSDKNGDIWSFTDRVGCSDRFQPREMMPAFADLGIQRVDIDAFESRSVQQNQRETDGLALPSPAPPQRDSTRLNNTLLKIIGLMVADKYKGEIGTPFKLAAVLSQQATQQGISLSDDTIAKHIKAALEAVEKATPSHDPSYFPAQK